MPVQPPGVWGIDLGQCGLKAIRLEESDGQIVATAFDYVEHPKILSQPDADPDQLTREALDKFLSRNTLRGDIVAISVPGQSGLARFVKLPPVEEKKIADIVRFEAKQQIPFNLDEVVWDYQKIGSGVVTDGFAMETEIGLFAMKRDMVNRYLQHFRDVNVDVHCIQMAPLALCNYVAFDLLARDGQAGEEGGGDKSSIVALDIGADSSNLVITDGDRIIWQRPIPLGGNHFTRALTKDLKLTFAKAEHLKRNATKSPDLKKILAALRPVLNDFVGEVQRSLGYFTNTHRDAHIEYMIGLGNAFRLPGLQKFLSEKLQLEVRKLVKMERVSGDQVVAQQAYTENVLTFAVAYGLALQGLKRGRLLTNLLPREIHVERLIKAKKPCAVAAAAALLLACGGLALSYGLEYRTYHHKRVLDAEEAAKSVKGRADQAKAAFTEAQNKARAEENAVRTIVAGQFERANWPELYKFIYTAIPQPDGQPRSYPILAENGSLVDEITLDNIPKEYLPRYWDARAQQANRDYLNEYGAAGSDGGNEPGENVKKLIQFNIESVQAFYCDKLDTFWDQLKKDENSKLKSDGSSAVRPEKHFNEKPTGSGWIVELHGWTYHQAKEAFIKNTLLENLARLGVPKEYKEKKANAAAEGNGAGAAGPTPGATPPVPEPAAATGAEPTQEQEPLGPIVNRISHVVLYDYAPSSANSSSFEILGEDTHETIRELALGQAGSTNQGGMAGMMGGSAGMPPGGPGGGEGGSSPGGGMMMSPGAGGEQGGNPEDAKTNSRQDWKPLGEEVDDQAFAANGMMSRMQGSKGKRDRKSMAAMAGMSMNGKDRMRKSKAKGGYPGMPNMPGPTGRRERSSTASDERGPERTEFVILFIWKEPTFSDNLRGLPAAAEDGDAAGGGASGGDAAAAQPPHLRPKPKAAAKEATEDAPKDASEDAPKKDAEKDAPKDAAKEDAPKDAIQGAK